MYGEKGACSLYNNKDIPYVGVVLALFVMPFAFPCLLGADIAPQRVSPERLAKPAKGSA